MLKQWTAGINTGVNQERSPGDEGGQGAHGGGEGSLLVSSYRVVGSSYKTQVYFEGNLNERMHTAPENVAKFLPKLRDRSAVCLYATRA